MKKREVIPGNKLSTIYRGRIPIFSGVSLEDQCCSYSKRAEDQKNCYLGVTVRLTSGDWNMDAEY